MGWHLVSEKQQKRELNKNIYIKNKRFFNTMHKMYPPPDTTWMYFHLNQYTASVIWMFTCASHVRVSSTRFSQSETLSAFNLHPSLALCNKSFPLSTMAKVAYSTFDIFDNIQDTKEMIWPIFWLLCFHMSHFWGMFSWTHR